MRTMHRSPSSSFALWLLLVMLTMVFLQLAMPLLSVRAQTEPEQQQQQQQQQPPLEPSSIEFRTVEQLKAIMQEDLRAVVHWRMPEGHEREWLSRPKGLENGAHVGLISFPRTGSTWLRSMLETVAGYPTETVYYDPGRTFRSIWNDETYIERQSLVADAVSLDRYALLPPSEIRRVVKTHCCSVQFASERFARIVRPYRSPLETLISFCKYTMFKMNSQADAARQAGKPHKLAHEMPSFEHTVNTTMVTMARHLVRWHCTLTVLSVMIPTLNVAYEDMLAEPSRVVESVARFIDYKNISRERVEAAVSVHPARRQAYDAQIRAMAAAVPQDVMLELAGAIKAECEDCLEMLNSVNLTTWDAYILRDSNDHVPWRVTPLYRPCRAYEEDGALPPDDVDVT